MNERVASVAASHDTLVGTVARMSDSDVRAPSLLPGWSRAEVVGHLVGNGRDLAQIIDAVKRGEEARQYPGGDAEREAPIRASREQRAPDLLESLRSSCRDVDRMWADLPADLWDRPVLMRRGPLSLRDVLTHRWVEVELHHVDLDLEYRCEDWPPAFVDAALPHAIDRLPQLHARSTAPDVQGSWHLHRTDAPGEWTLHVGGDGARLESGHAKGDCALRGPGWVLLAYAYGRAGLDALEVFGDGTLAARFKAVFPGP